MLERRTLLCGLTHFSPSVLAEDAALEAARAQAGGEPGALQGGGTFNINWTNRGNDNFGPIFGNRAEAARNVVETVMQAWENAIVHMHDQGGRNYINVDVYMDSDVTGFGALARTVETEFGFPVRGDIEIGNGTAGATDRGWFIDDSPLQHGEFLGTIVNAFAGDAQAGSAAFGMPDLYTVVNSELVHLLGITSQEDTFWNDPGFTNPSGFTDTLEGGGIGELHYMLAPFNQLMTTYNSGGGGTDTGEPLHTAPGSLFVEPAVGTIYGSQDAGNASYEMGRRYLVPNNIARLLNFGYGYEIVDPELQATFYATLTDGSLLVRGSAGIDTIDVFRDFATNEIVVSVDLANDVRGTGPTDAFITRYPSQFVTSIQIAAGDSNDVININTNVNLPTTVDLAAGDDRLSVRGKGLGLSGMMAITVNGVDDGSDTLELIGERAGDTVLVDFTGVTHSGGFTLTDSGQFEKLEIDCHFGQTDIRVTRFGAYTSLLINGSAQADTIHLNELVGGLPTNIFAGGGSDIVRLRWIGSGFISTAVAVYGEAGDDTLELTNGNLARLSDGASFTPGTGVDTIIFHDEHDGSSTPLGTSYSFTPQFVTATRPGFLEEYYIADTENVLFGGDIGNNRFTVAPNVTARLQLFGNSGNDIFDGAGASAATLYGQNGDDEFVLGNGNLAPSASLVAAFGEAGNDIITFDDHLSTLNLPWTINGDGPAIPRRVFLGINEYSYAGFEQIRILGGTAATQEFRLTGTFDVGIDIDGGGGGDNIIVGFQSQAQFLAPVTLRGGSGNDTFQWTRASNNWYTLLSGPIAYDVLLDGGTGYNTLAIDETTRSAGGYNLYPDRFYATDGGVFPVGFDFDYDNVQAMSFTAGGGTTNLAVIGTSSDIDPGNQISVALGGGNDNVYLYPHDAQGNLTINGNVGIGGGTGTDNLFVIDSASPTPANYAFANPFGAGTQNITGLGIAGFGIGSDFEGITMTGSPGNDVYAINSYKSGMGMTINGGLGDDVCNFGNNDIAANVTSIASFLFNGMEGTDTFNLRNATSSSAFTYTAAANTTLQVSRSLPTSYFVSLEYYNTEQKVVYAGPAADVMNITSFASGELSFHAGAGDDTLNLPTSSDLLGRRVNYYGGAGTLNRITQSTNTKSSATTLHIFQNTIGAFPGDNFFAPGGSVFFDDSVQTMALRMGTGPDTVFIQPQTVARININGDAPLAPGDTLNFALAATANPVFTGSAASGSLTSSNRATVTYTNFEVGPNVDAIAPAVIDGDINVIGIPGFVEGSGNQQSVDVQFSENVSGLISPASIQLTNLTTGQTIPSANVAVEYDLATNTAHFTFPGYVNGVLPDGDYSGKIFAGLPDFFGNPLPADATFNFFFLNGDANRDRRVDLDDFNILASNFNQSNKTFSQGDFTYDGLVNLDDFNILAGKFNTTLSAARSGSGFKNATRNAAVDRLLDLLL